MKQQFESEESEEEEKTEPDCLQRHAAVCLCAYEYPAIVLYSPALLELLQSCLAVVLPCYSAVVLHFY